MGPTVVGKAEHGKSENGCCRAGDDRGATLLWRSRTGSQDWSPLWLPPGRSKKHSQLEMRCSPRRRSVRRSADTVSGLAVERFVDARYATRMLGDFTADLRGAHPRSSPS